MDRSARDWFFIILLGSILGFLLNAIVSGDVFADRPSFLDQSIDKTIIYGPHGTAETRRGPYGQGTGYIYPEDAPQGCDDCDEEREEYYRSWDEQQNEEGTW